MYVLVSRRHGGLFLASVPLGSVGSDGGDGRRPAAFAIARVGKRRAFEVKSATSAKGRIGSK